ncbi:uncharacterized protein LOC134282647 [Saccostrea cucullata]|uniref:uncharacterized protein LOC134282647 n=1 Tax=Saccostrea cuccullata TaxID=36930 RepID=UPI002ED3598B
MEVQRSKKSAGGKLMKHFTANVGAIPIIGNKASKPITEKRRRDRINKCLVQLKNIVMRAKGKDEKRFAKMEKADILEMTIGHLVEMHQQNIGKRFVDHWGIATPQPKIPMDPFIGMRNNVRGYTNQGFHPSEQFYTPAYKCGYSGDKEIMDVNFETDDVMESSSVMCGSASRVFVFVENKATTRTQFKEDQENLSKEWNRFPHIHDPLLTSTPVDVSAIKPIRTSTPLDLPSQKKTFFSPDELLLSGRYDIDLNTSPDLRVRLFTSNEESSDGSLGRKSVCESTSAELSSESSSSGGSNKENSLWRPW